MSVMQTCAVRLRVLAGVVGAFVWLPVAQAAGKEPGTHHTVRFTSESGYPLAIKAMQFSPDGSVLAVSIASRGISLVDTDKGETIAHRRGDYFAIAYCRDGSRLFALSERRSELLNANNLQDCIPMPDKSVAGLVGVDLEMRNGKLLIREVIPGSPAARSGEISNGDELVGVGEGKTGTMRRVVGWTDRSAQNLTEGMAGTHVRLELIPKGQWNSTTTALCREAVRREGDRLEFVPFTPSDVNENAVWGVVDGRPTLFSARDGEVLSVFDLEEVEPRGRFALSPDGKTFAVLGMRPAGDEAAIELFDVGSRHRLGCVTFPKESWYHVTFSGDGGRLLVGTWDTVEVLDVKYLRFLQPVTLGWNGPPSEIEAPPRRRGSAGGLTQAAGDRNASGRRSEHSPHQLVTSLACLRENIIVTGDAVGNVSLWNVDSGAILCRLPPTEQGRVQAAQCSATGRWLAYYVEGTLHIVDVLPQAESHHGE